MKAVRASLTAQIACSKLHTSAS